MVLFQNVPKGDWFCPDCRPKETKKRSPRKERRRTFSEHQSSDEEEDDDEEAEDRYCNNFISAPDKKG